MPLLFGLPLWRLEGGAISPAPECGAPGTRDFFLLLRLLMGGGGGERGGGGCRGSPNGCSLGVLVVTVAPLSG